jgi:hypothetical protein
MKKLLLMLVVSLCALAWRSEDMLKAFAAAGGASVAPKKPVSVNELVVQSQPGQQPMSAEELLRLSRTDPDAYRKFLASRTVRERSAADKLMNFFAHGKYE